MEIHQEWSKSPALAWRSVCDLLLESEKQVMGDGHSRLKSVVPHGLVVGSGRESGHPVDMAQR